MYSVTGACLAALAFLALASAAAEVQDDAGSVEQLKILMLPTLMSEAADSHLKYGIEFGNVLSNAGFNVTFMVSELSEQFLTKRIGAEVTSIYFGAGSVSVDNDVLREFVHESCETGDGTSALLYFHALDVQRCDSILGDAELLEKLKSEEFDLAMVELFPGACSILIADAIGLRFASYTPGIESIGEPHLTYYEQNYPYPVATTPMFDSPLKMNFLQRIRNLFYYVVGKVVTVRVLSAPYVELKIRHDINSHESLLDLYQKTEMTFINCFLGFQYPRAVPPNFHMIAGLSAYPPSHSLPDDIVSFIGSAGPNGVVFLAFGVTITGHMVDEDTNKIFTALSGLDEKVIAPWKGDAPATLGKNTKVWKWLPQNDVLADPNVKAVVSHCGLNSLMESIYHKKPVVCISFWGDSVVVVPQCVSIGVCKEIPFNDLSPESLRRAVEEITTNPDYKRSVTKVSAMMNDRPLNGAETLEFWVGHWFRNNGSEFTKITAPNDLNYFQYFLVDVIAFLAAVMLIIVYIVCRVVKYSLAMVFGRSNPKAKKH